MTRGKFNGSPKRGSRKSYVIFKRLGFVHGLSFVLMEPNRAALMSAVQLEQPVDSPIYDAGQESTAADNVLGLSFGLLCAPKVAVIESALLMLLIGWIDYVTDFNVTVFYFVPVVLATWRAGRKSGGVVWLLF